MSTWTQSRILNHARTKVDALGYTPSSRQWNTVVRTPNTDTVRRHFHTWENFRAALTAWNPRPTYTGWTIDTSVHTLFLQDDTGDLTAYAWIAEDDTIDLSGTPWPWDISTVGAAIRALRASTGALMQEAGA